MRNGQMGKGTFFLKSDFKWGDSGAVLVLFVAQKQVQKMREERMINWRTDNGEQYYVKYTKRVS